MDQQFQPALQLEAQAATVRADGLDPSGDALKTGGRGFDPGGIEGRTAPEAALGKAGLVLRLLVAVQEFRVGRERALVGQATLQQLLGEVAPLVVKEVGETAAIAVAALAIGDEAHAPAARGQQVTQGGAGLAGAGIVGLAIATNLGGIDPNEAHPGVILELQGIAIDDLGDAGGLGMGGKETSGPGGEGVEPHHQ
jgi:hypothetical protein